MLEIRGDGKAGGGLVLAIQSLAALTLGASAIGFALWFIPVSWIVIRSGNFFAGEHFTGLSPAQAAAEVWCKDVAGMRIHGTIAARPAQGQRRGRGEGVG